ncbi:MAG: T9SS type A sorting domain-containing protein [Bacteroidia bacterium]|nr:T9SS type A sorting domain-containing protein [Bacteroidia bacterium]
MMLMTHEVEVVCQGVPGDNVSISAEADGDVYGANFRLLDSGDPNNYKYFYSDQSSALSNGQNVDQLLWDFTDDNTAGAGKLMYGFYEFTGPNDTKCYLNYLHCYAGGPDVQLRFSYSGGVYSWAWNDGGNWVTFTNLNLWEITNESRDVSCFQVDVTLQNVFHLKAGGTRNDYGSIFVDNISTSYPSPSTVEFDLESNHDSWPSLNITNAVESGVIHKFHDWNGYEVYHNVIHNWDATTITKVDANHKHTSGGLGKVRFDGTPSTSTVEMRDPWKVVWPQNDRPYSDFDFHQISFPYNGYNFKNVAGMGGLFDGEDPTSPAHSYFSIRTPEYLEWNGSSWVLAQASNFPAVGDAMHWKFRGTPNEHDIMTYAPVNQSHVVSDYVTKDLVLQTEETDVLVEYKTHLLSSTPVQFGSASGPLGANSQRQVDMMSNDGYVAVYESNEYIWLMRSAPDPVQWEWELPLGPGIRPSLWAVGDSAYVSWIHDGRIQVGKYHAGQFNMLETCTLINYEPADHAYPVVAYIEDFVCLVYEAQGRTDLFYVVIQNDTWYDEGIVPDALSSGISCLTPSMTTSPGGFHLAWREGDDIATRTMTVQTWTNPPQIAFDAPELLPRYNEWYVGAPSITKYHFDAQPPNDILRVVAAPSRGSFGDAKINIFSMDVSLTWSPMQSFFGNYYTNDIWAPSLSSIDRDPCAAAYDNVRCAFNVADLTTNPVSYSTRAVGVNCGTWQVNDPQVSQATHPTLVAFPPENMGLELYIDLASNDVPTPLASTCKQIGSTRNALNKASASNDLLASRVLWLREDTAWVGLGLGNMLMQRPTGDEPIDWHQLPKPGTAISPAGVGSYILSDEFVPNAQSVLRYSILRERLVTLGGPDVDAVYIELLDAGTGNVLEIIENIDPSALQVGRNITTVYKSLQSYSDRNVRLRMRPLFNVSAPEFAVADYYNIERDSTVVFPKAQSESEMHVATPEASDIRLEQNYPNPFNPVTTLRYYLPRSSFVTFRVYDNLGIIVTTLKEGDCEAGSHSVTFDARGLASGNYIAKLTVDGYSVMRRMTLLR